MRDRAEAVKRFVRAARPIPFGIGLVPIVLVKLWSAMPQLFEWPPLRSPAHALNVQLYYPWHFSFLAAHFYGGWVFLAAFALHAAVKLPTVRRSLRERRLIDELRRGLPDAVAESGRFAAHPGGAERADDLAPWRARPDRRRVARAAHADRRAVRRRPAARDRAARKLDPGSSRRASRDGPSSSSPPSTSARERENAQPTPTRPPPLRPAGR